MLCEGCQVPSGRKDNPSNAKEIDELAIGLVGYDVFPRPADCGMPVEVAFLENAGYMDKSFF